MKKNQVRVSINIICLNEKEKQEEKEDNRKHNTIFEIFLSLFAIPLSFFVKEHDIIMVLFSYIIIFCFFFRGKLIQLRVQCQMISYFSPQVHHTHLSFDLFFLAFSSTDKLSTCFRSKRSKKSNNK